VKRIALLGSTGSIGRQAINVIRRYPDRFDVYALACSRSLKELIEQVKEFKPKIVCLRDAALAREFDDAAGEIADDIDIVHSVGGLGLAAAHPQVDCVLNAIVGFPGLYPSLNTIEEGKTLLLANKESLVMAGKLLMNAAEEKKCDIIPIDSEHSAIFQCIDKIGDVSSKGVRRIILTASGGPFLKRPLDTFESITLNETLNHPTWNMGPKITIDSATMFNKGFEIIEACFLFGLPVDKIDVVIHPQSIVHSMVEFNDGSVLAQMSYPTMEIPIQYALMYPERLPTDVAPLDLAKEGTLEFEEPDLERFPSIALARQALEMGGTAPAAMNLANDEAVRLFLNGKISFPAITASVKYVLDNVDVIDDYMYEDILELKKQAESRVNEWIQANL